MASVTMAKGVVNSYNPYAKLTVTQSSQSIDGNYSIVAYNLKVYRPSSVSSSASKSYSISINGSKVASGTYTLGGSGTKTIKSGTVKVAHNSDGTKSVAFSASVEFDVTWSGKHMGTYSKSGSLTLSTIPRATTPKLSTGSVAMGGSVTISLPRASSSFTHDLAYSFAGGSYVSIATGVATSYSWTVPDLASQIPNAASGTVTIRCITKNGSTSIGTKTVALTASVPTSVVPTVGTISLEEAVAEIVSSFGVYLQDKSKVKATITASGAKGSTVTAYESTFQGKVYTGSSWTSDLLTSYGTLTIKTRVKDSRGRWSEYKSATLTVVQYFSPKITKLQAYRVDSSGAAKDDGIYAYLTYAYQVAPVDGKNTASMKVEYKRSTAAEYASGDVLLTGTALSADTGGKIDSPTLSSDYSYDLRMTVADIFGASATYVTSIPSGAVVIDLRANGLGIAFGKTSEGDGVEFGWDIVDQIKTFGSLSGRYKTHDGLLLQWGSVTITPDAAGTPKTAVVTFPLAYASTPAVFVSPVTSVPHSVDVGVQRAADIVGDPAKAVGVTLTRSGLTGTGIYWFAIGKEAV